MSDYSKEDATSTRYMCDIFHDMRNCHKTRNYSYLLGLIEEAQYRANRMENRIGTISDVERMEKKRIDLKKEIKELEAELEKLRQQKPIIDGG